jgi:hypothetical protein
MRLRQEIRFLLLLMTLLPLVFISAPSGARGQASPKLALTVEDLTTGQPISSGEIVANMDKFDVTVTTTNGIDCAGQWIVTALGAPGFPPSVPVQVHAFVIGPGTHTPSVTGAPLTANGVPNDWKISASCNAAEAGQFVEATVEFFVGMKGPSSASSGAIVPADSNGGHFGDNFTVVSQLKPEEWQTNTPLLDAIAQAYDSKFVPGQISFSEDGLRLTGVDGKYQFTGIQSTRNFSPPFSVEAKVMGAVSNGIPFGLFLVNADLTEHLSVIGDVNSQNGPYYGAWVDSAPTGDLRKGQVDLLYHQVNPNTWYTVRESVQADGTASVVLVDANGSILASKYYLHVGKGPFFVVMGQRAGWPVTVGPNVAVWASLNLTPLVAPNAIAYADFSSSTIQASNVSIIPGADFSYNNTFGGSWRILGPGGGFIGFVTLPEAGLYDLTVTHLTSMSPTCPNRGYSPVTIQVNSATIVGNYDPGSSHGASHGMVTDAWAFIGHAGQNTLEWTGSMLCTHYWIQRIQFDLVQPFPSHRPPATALSKPEPPRRGLRPVTAKLCSSCPVRAAFARTDMRHFGGGISPPS